MKFDVKAKRTHMKDGLGKTKDEVNRTLNIAAIIVMSAFEIKESVMRTIECTMVECNHVCSNIGGH